VKSAVETLSPTRVRLTVEVPFDELTPSLDAAYRKIAQQVTIPGFRKGKVPARVIDQRIGRGAVLEEAVNEALPTAYGAAVEENQIRVLGRPEVEVTEFEDGADLKFTAEVDVRPEITLPELADISVTVDAIEVTDDDVEEQVEALRSRFASLTAVERAAQTGDVVTVDIATTHEGDPVEEMSATGLSYEVGSGNLLEGLDDVITGKAAGEGGTFSTMPRSDTLDAEVVDVTATVTAVRERELPALDDEFAQLVSEFDTLEELRTALRDELLPRKQIEQLIAARDAVMQTLVDTVEVPVPEGVIDEQVEQHFTDGHGDDAHRDEYVEQARETLRRDLLLDAIADRDNLTVSQAELTEYLVRQAPQYGMTPDQFASALANAGQVSMIYGEVLRAKALATAVEQATVVDSNGNQVDVSPEPEEAAEDTAAEVVADEAEQPEPASS
jgi:trigger factor